MRHAAIEARRARRTCRAVSWITLAHQIAEREALLAALDDALAALTRIGVLDATRTAEQRRHGGARGLHDRHGRLHSVLHPREERRQGGDVLGDREAAVAAGRSVELHQLIGATDRVEHLEV